MKRHILLILVMAIMICSLAGCTHKQPDFPDELKKEPTPTRIHGGYRTNLYMWWDESDKDVRLLQDAWYDFITIYAGQKYPQNINMFHMKGDVNGTTQLEQQVVAGTAPDLVKMDHVYITALGQKGLVFDLQEKWQATDKISNQFVKPTWEAFTSGDAVYGIPFDANTVIFGAKTDVLQQVGLSIPTNYTELQNVGTKMLTLSGDMKPYYLPLDGYDWSPIASHYMTWLWRLGGDLLNEDLTKATFNDTETGVKALQMMLQLKADLLIATDRHEEEKAAMRDYGTWWVNGLKENMEFGLQPTLKEDVPAYSILGVQGFGVVTTAKNPDLAYDFAVHFATEQCSITKKHYAYTYCQNHNLFPALKTAIQTKEIWDANSEVGEFWRTSAQQLELSKYRPAVPCWPEIEEALTTAILFAYEGEKTPQQALDDAAELANRLLEEWHATQH